MVGDEDVSTPKALADRIVGAIPQAKLIVVPCAGHGSTLEQPAIVTAAIGAAQGDDHGLLRPNVAKK